MIISCINIYIGRSNSFISVLSIPNLEIINIDRVFTRPKEEDEEEEEEFIDKSSSYHQIQNNPTLTSNTLHPEDDSELLLHQLKKSKSNTYIRKSSLVTLNPLDTTALDISVQSAQLTLEARKQRHNELNALKFNINDVKYNR